MKKNKNTKTTAKKITKTTKPTAPKQSYKTSELKAKTPSLIEEMPPIVPYESWTATMAFDDAYGVFDALYGAFHNNSNMPEGDVDSRFVALWTLFLASISASEDMFWDTLDSETEHHTCAECRKEQEEATKKIETVKAKEDVQDAEVEEVIEAKVLPPNKQFN